MAQATAGRTKSDVVYRRIRDLIENGKVHNGQRLSEAHFARMLGVSRGPVRESLMRLESEGLVQHRGSRRSRVVSYTEDENHDELVRRYEVRQFVEAGAAALAAIHMSGLQIQRLRDFAEQAAACREAGDQKGRYEANAAFHDYLLDNCGNPMLREIYTRHRLAPARPRTRAFEKRFEAAVSSQVSPSLLPVVEAIAAHDVETASQLIFNQVRRATEALRKMAW